MNDLLRKRVERLEHEMRKQCDDSSIVVMLIHERRDLFELPEDPAQWKTWPGALAEARPGRPKIITVDSTDERKARGMAIEQN